MESYHEHTGRWRKLDEEPSQEIMVAIDHLIYGGGSTPCTLFGKARSATYYHARSHGLAAIDKRLRDWLGALGYSEIKIDLQVR